jgi:hypothetical protein
MVTSIKGNATSTFGGAVDLGSSNLTTTGIVTSGKPAFSVVTTSNQNNGGTAGGYLLVDFHSANVDTHSAFDLSNDKYVVPVTGNYYVTANVSFWASSVSARYIRASIFVDSNIKVEQHTHISNETGDADYCAVTMSGILPLTAGQELTLKWGTSTTSTITIQSPNGNCTFSGYML